MKTLYITRGLPGSGKSTWAMELCRKKNAGNITNMIRLNRDDIKLTMFPGSKWFGGNEEYVTTVQEVMVQGFLDVGLDIIIDDTNLNPKVFGKWRRVAENRGINFHCEDFTHVPVETCIERDLARHNSSGTALVGEKVIRDMATKYLNK